MQTGLPPPINTEPIKPRRVYIRSSVDLTRYGYTSGCVGCEAAMIQVPSRDHTDQCRARIILGMSSDADLSVRVREAHERMSRSVSEVEPRMEKARFTERATVAVSSVTFTPRTVLAPVTYYGGSPPSLALPHATPSVEHERPDDSDERIGSKKVKMSESGSLPGHALMSADADLSIDDMKVECLLDQFERERIASKSNDNHWMDAYRTISGRCWP